MSRLAVLLYRYFRTRYGRKWKDRQAFERWQERQVLRSLRWIRERSPFYRRLWAGRPLTEWRHFPEIDKSVMMDEFDLLNTAGIRKDEAMRVALEAENTRNFRHQIGDVTIGLSSGTSGNRGLFLVDSRERAAWAGTMLAKLLPKPLWKADKVAFFLRANSNLYESVQQGRLQFEYFDLLEPAEKHIAQLEAYRPGILVAPPSVLRLLATAKLEQRLTAAPHTIFSVAEVLDPLDAKYIKDAFGQIIHQVYQCTEGFLASTCSYGTIHLNEDLLCVEKEYAQDGSRRFIPIITDFSRTTQPIVRYRLNDLLTEAAELCPCGSVMTAIERIEGRCDDIFYLPHEEDNGLLVPVYPDFITRAIIGASAKIEEYRAIQRRLEHIEISLRVDADEREQVEKFVEEHISALFQRLRCAMPALTFTEYAFVPGARKLRRVERSCSLERSGLPV